MKSFSDFLVEKKKDRNRPGPQGPSEVDVQQSRSRFSAGKKKSSSPKPLTQSQIAGAWKSGAGGGKSAIGTSRKPEGPTWFGTDIKAIKAGQEAESELRQQVRDTVAKNPTSSPELQRAQSSGPPEEMVGSSKKPRTKPGSYVVQPPRVKPTGSLRAGNLSFPGDVEYKKMLGNIPNAPTTLQRTRRPRVGTSGRATTQVFDTKPFSSKEFKTLRYGRGRSGPSSPLRTPSQVTKFQQGLEKGYFDPNTNKLTSAGIQRYTDSRAAAGPNFAKGDPRAALSKVQDLVSRAASGDREARKEVRKTYKAATTGYKPPQGTPPAPSKATPPPSQVIAQTQQTGRIETSKLASTPSTAPKGGGSSGPSKSGGGVLTPEKVKTTLSGPLKSGPAPSTPTKKPTAASFTPGKTKPGTGLYTPPAKPAPVKPASVKPALVGASTNNAAKELEKVSGKVIRQMRADRTAAAVKAVRNLGRASTVLGTTLDFQSAFQKAKQSGAGQLRAIGAGTAAAGGGLAGAATGARLGGLVGGLPGSIVGGILGYTGGVKKAGQIYRGVVGKPGEQVTSQSVLKNIKKVYRQEVPTSIRQVVPKQVKKGFTDFYNQAVGAAKRVKKGYDSYTKAQQIKKEVTK